MLENKQKGKHKLKIKELGGSEGSVQCDLNLNGWRILVKK